jgi:hypothetical protein
MLRTRRRVETSGAHKTVGAKRVPTHFRAPIPPSGRSVAWRHADPKPLGNVHLYPPTKPEGYQTPLCARSVARCPTASRCAADIQRGINTSPMQNTRRAINAAGHPLRGVEQKPTVFGELQAWRATPCRVRGRAVRSFRALYLAGHVHLKDVEFLSFSL